MDKNYDAAMIVIGNEILSGRTQDENINYVARKLVACGVALSEVRVIPDEERAIIRAIHDLIDRVDYIFTSGGIGPTHDDITAQSVAKAFDLPLEENKETRAILAAHYGGDEYLTPARLKMARMPRGARLIDNPVSGASGFMVNHVYVMAGVPRIMHAMMDHVALTLKGGALVQSRTVVAALRESEIAEALEAVQHAYPSVEIGSYPYFEGGAFGVNIVLRSSDADALARAEEAVLALVQEKS